MKNQKKPEPISLETYVRILERYMNRYPARIAALGLTEDEISSIMGSRKITQLFLKYMVGQTCGYDARLGRIFYPQDVIRFFMTLRGNKPLWD